MVIKTPTNKDGYLVKKQKLIKCYDVDNENLSCTQVKHREVFTYKFENK